MPTEMLEQGYYITTGAGPDLMENAKNAVRDMIDWLVTDQQLSMHEAYTLCSVVGDLKISETVDLPNWLVSMTLPPRHLQLTPRQLSLPTETRS